MEPVVSVIIPVYNCARFLPRCLDSAISQTLKNIEIILVDDGSSDSSGKICDEYAGRDKRIKVFHCDNSGVSAARNKAISYAAGEYIAFFDSDDVPDRSFLEKMYTFAKKHDCNIVVSSFCLVESGVREEIYSLGNEIIERDRWENFKWLAHENVIYNSVWNKMYRRSLIVENNVLFPEGIIIGEDNLFNMCAFYHTESAFFLPDSLYNYFVMPGSAMQTKDTIENRFIFIGKRCEKLREYGYYERYYDIIVKRLYQTCTERFGEYSKILCVKDISFKKLSGYSKKVYILVRLGIYPLWYKLHEKLESYVRRIKRRIKKL